MARSALQATSRFRSERELVTAFQRAFVDPRGPNWRWFEELPVPSGLADIVGVRLSPSWQAQRPLAAVPPRWAHALSALPLGIQIDAADFSRVVGASVAHARSMLRTFEQAGYCRYCTATSRWTKELSPDLLANRVVTIEAKLHDWRRALAQAFGHRAYVYQSWVVVDHAGAISADLEQFRSRGVGLGSMSPRGDFDVLVQASPREPTSAARVWYTNAEIARRIFGQAQP